MSGSANNLPIKVTLDGVDDVNRQIRSLADSFTAPQRAAEQLPAAVARTSEAFNQLEGRAQAGRRALNDLGGAIELLGGGGGGAIGAAASYVGNLADLFGTASLASGRLEAAAGVLSGRLTTLAGVVALPIFLQQVGLGINNAGEAAADAATTTDSWRATIEQLNPVLAENARLAGEAAEATKRLRDQQAGLEQGFGRVLERRAFITGELGPGGRLTNEIGRAEGELQAAAAAVARESARPLSDDRRQFLQRQLEAAENRLRGLQSEAGVLNAELAALSSNRGPAAPGEAGSANFEFVTTAARLTAPTLSTEPFGPPAPEAERPGRGGGGSGRVEDAEAAFDRAEALARRAAESAARAGQRTKDLREETERTNDFARELGLTFSSAFEDAIVKGNDLRSVLQGLVQDISRIVVRQAVTTPLANAFGSAISGGFSAGPGASGGSLDFSKLLGFTNLLGGGDKSADFLASANGNAFGYDGLIPFARGGIVDQPTIFPFANGTGLMGEAGPEAIMPLKRGRDGKLGVAGGGGGQVVNVTIMARDAGSFFGKNGRQVTRELAAAVDQGRR